MNHIHDKQYKRIFSIPVFAEKLLKSFVHERFVKHLNFKTLKKLDKSYITKKMEKYESDIVYEIYYKDKPVYIYILLEFQSSVDKKMPLRFLRYILELYEDCGKSKKSKKYPAIFPLLLYNGEAKWSAKLNVSDLIEQSIPTKYIPNFSYYPILINEIDNKTLLKIENGVSAIFYMENSDSSVYDKAIEELVTIIRNIPIFEAKEFGTWLVHFFNNQDIELSDRDFNNITKSEEIMTMMAAGIERYKERLLNEGKAEGSKEKSLEIAKNFLKAGIEAEFVAKNTGLSIEEVKNIKY